jgi:hypothetical protein
MYFASFIIYGLICVSVHVLNSFHGLIDRAHWFDTEQSGCQNGSIVIKHTTKLWKELPYCLTQIINLGFF